MEKREEKKTQSCLWVCRETPPSVMESERFWPPQLVADIIKGKEPCKILKSYKHTHTLDPGWLEFGKGPDQSLWFFSRYFFFLREHQESLIPSPFFFPFLLPCFLKCCEFSSWQPQPAPTRTWRAEAQTLGQRWKIQILCNALQPLQLAAISSAMLTLSARLWTLLELVIV